MLLSVFFSFAIPEARYRHSAVIDPTARAMYLPAALAGGGGLLGLRWVYGGAQTKTVGSQGLTRASVLVLEALLVAKGGLA